MPRQSTRLTLVNDVNFLLYTPFLPEAAAGTLEPRHVVTPLREILKRTNLRLGEIEAHDPAARTVSCAPAKGEQEELRYDQLLIALGSVSRVLPVPGLAEHAIGFKTLADAIWLRNHVIETLEAANATDDPARRDELLTYVFVGGGYAGLEALAELQDFAADAIEQLSARPPARDALDPGRGRRPGAAGDRRRARRLRAARAARPRHRHPARNDAGGGRRRQRPHLDRRDAADPDRRLDRGRRPEPDPAPPLDCRSTSAAGCRSTSTCGCAGMDSGLGDRRLRRGARPAWRRLPADRPARGAAGPGRRPQHRRRARGSAAPRPFDYRGNAAFVNLGRYKAVGRIGARTFRGFPAWWMARTYHMSQIPGAARKVRAVIDWTASLPFRRDLAEVGSIGHPKPLGETMEPWDSSISSSPSSSG